MAQKFLDYKGLQTLVTNIKNYITGYITGGATTIIKDNLTANKALVSNANGKVASSSVTSTQLRYLENTTSDIQSQINNTNTNITTNTNNISTLSNSVNVLNGKFVNGVLSASAGGTGVNNLSSLSVGTATTATKLGSATVGSSTNPIYLNSGTATASNMTIGAKNKPVYLDSGTITAGIRITYGTSLPTSGMSEGDIFILIS